jgi:hypothetical protein
LFVVVAGDEEHVVGIAQDEGITHWEAEFENSDDFVPFEVEDADESVLAGADCHSQVGVHLDVVYLAVVRDYLLLVDQSPATVNVRRAEVAGAFADVLPDDDLAVDGARDDQAQLFVGCDSHYSVAVFCVDFGFVGDQIVFEDLAAPHAADENVFAPHRADG